MKKTCILILISTWIDDKFDELGVLTSYLHKKYIISKSNIFV